MDCIGIYFGITATLSVELLEEPTAQSLLCSSHYEQGLLLFKLNYTCDSIIHCNTIVQRIHVQPLGIFRPTFLLIEVH